MLKYTNYQLGFAEVPEETSICINISNCPNHCPDCHSKFLWNDAGYELNEEVIDDILQSKDAALATCFCFMGGDAEPKRVWELSDFIREKYQNIKTAWYSGAASMDINAIQHFDYIKIGPYIKEFGSLNLETTNQQLFKIVDGELIDITNKFWL